MKSTVAAVGLMASLVSASAYQPRHFHWRRDNTTASVSAPAGYTTLTVQVTEIATVTSCAPTVTNCPARSATLSGTELATFVVTNVIHLTETVCPVTAAEQLSKSIIEEHSKGNLPGTTLPATATPTAPAGVPLSTGGGVPGAGVPSNPAGVPSKTASAQDATVTSPPVNGEGDDEDDDCPADEGEVETSVTDIISTKYITVTVGQGSTASVITSAVETTAKSTVLVTKPASVPVGGSVTGVTEAGEPTTTTTATSTNTRTVTVKRPAASGTPGTGSGSGNGSGSGSGSGSEECTCPSAVTVTVPASTVYVTIGGSSAPTSAPVAGSGSDSGSGSGSGNGAGNGASPSKTASAQAPATTEAADAGEGDDECPADEAADDGEEDDDCPADEEVVTLSSTVTVAPFPTNGTNGGSAKPTGAAYRRSQNLF